MQEDIDYKDLGIMDDVIFPFKRLDYDPIDPVDAELKKALEALLKPNPLDVDFRLDQIIRRLVGKIPDIVQMSRVGIAAIAERMGDDAWKTVLLRKDPLKFLLGLLANPDSFVSMAAFQTLSRCGSQRDIISFLLAEDEEEAKRHLDPLIQKTRHGSEPVASYTRRLLNGVIDLGERRASSSREVYGRIAGYVRERLAEIVD